jgi:hypothetical protein
MKKILFLLPVLFICQTLTAQKEIRGVTVSGIKGIQRSLASVIAYDKAHPVPLNYRPRLRPELEGPRPKGQQPGSQKVSKSGSQVQGDNYKVTVTSAPTQAVHSNFLTIWGSYSGATGRESPYTPPDNCGDVGTTQIIATANCRMKVFNKPTVNGPASTTPTGTSTTTLPAVVDVNLNTFFTNTALGITGISDPHVRFDRLTGRWFIVAIDVNHSNNNYCCIAVSNGPTITASSSFSIYYFRVSTTGGSANDFFDYPTLGIDKNSLYIGGNMFAFSSSWSGVNMWVVNKANLLAGTLTVTGFPQSVTGTDMYTPQGVHNDDPNATNGYFVGTSQTWYAKVVIRRISYSGGTPTLSPDLNLTTLNVYAPRTVPTLGGIAIDGGDHRLYAAMIKKNKITGSSNLWVAQCTKLNNIGIGGSGGDRNGALWLEIGNLATTPSILQSATLYDDVNPTSSAVSYTYPSIAVSGQGHNVMGFTSAGPAKYAQAAVAGRYRTDPAGNFQAPVDFTTSTSTYSPLNSSGSPVNRWGDYTQTVVDPSDDMTMWTFSEYTATTNSWGVRAAQLKAPPPSTPVLASVPACGGTSTITINGTTVNSSEFFDPGNDAGGPGFSRLKVDVSGPSSITVSNIVFVNPTQVKADLTVPANAASGPYTLTVTNPDGQSSSTTFSINCIVACASPSALTSTNITHTSATLGWSAVTGATGYDVDYKLSSSATWINVVSGSASNSVDLSGITEGSNYNWRVRTICAPGVTSTYTESQFTTVPLCNAPSGLASSAITSSSATVSWSAVSGANSYDVDYKISTASLWSSAAIATTATSVNIGGLSALTAYDWRVRTNCSTESSGYAGSSFTTASNVCQDQYEPNNTIATSAAIPLSTDIKALIATTKDLDYYKFSNTADRKKVKITLTNLPVDIDMKLYGTNNNQLAHSGNSGLKDEVIIYNTNNLYSFKVYVYGKSGRYHATQCYTLNVQLGATDFSKNAADSDGDVEIDDDASNNMVQTLRSGLKVYPVPASNIVTVTFDAYAKGKADIVILNQLGQVVLIKKVGVSDGINFNTLDITALLPGVYTVKVNNGKGIQTTKLLVHK